MVFAIRLQSLRGGGLAERGARRVDGREGHHEEDQERDAEDHQRQLQQSPTDEAERVGHVPLLPGGWGVTGVRASGSRTPVVWGRCYFAATPTSRNDRPVVGTGWKPTSSWLLQAVGSLRWNSG
ncbi:Uncharacterised protein [Mycobacterium tuberculosis]|nr:Uncharacterised protein [Mycobacterium tuberculosis]